MKILNKKNQLEQLVIALCVFFSCSHIYADATQTPSALKHNPFAAPALINVPVGTISTDTSPADLRVRAVLISEAGTLVNINGSIIALNEFVDGYQLISLERDQAVLSRDGSELVLNFPSSLNSLGLHGQ